MPVLDMDPKSSKWNGWSLKFRVQCDCVGEGDGCAAIVHSYFDGNDDDEIEPEMYVSAIPATFPFSLWHRIKNAWHMLWYGRYAHIDQIVLQPETIDAWAKRLSEVAEKLRESPYNNYKYERVKIDPNKD